MPDHRLRSGPSLAGRRIGLLGGSFNPAHDGHRFISLYAIKQLRLDQVWWLVSPQNPLKSAKGMASLKSRCAMAATIARHPKIVVTALEAELRTRYTADTLRVLRQRFPRTRFVWLMGADNLQQITAWNRWTEIFRLMPIAVLRRPTYAAGRKASKAAQRFEAAWLPARRAGSLASLRPPAWMVLQNRYNKLSATEIRRRLQR
ncbi:MAG: nicotinate-nucleotide adenylyltransferase [Pseudomonadota bacterium]|nr:nicotinate-nucleotide adenylyltransferase [Pseudomonadota bacterium]